MKIIKNPDSTISSEVEQHFQTSNICPCRVEETKCQCDDFKNQTEGLCDCLRFLKVDE